MALLLASPARTSNERGSDKYLMQYRKKALRMVPLLKQHMQHDIQHTKIRVDLCALKEGTSPVRATGKGLSFCSVSTAAGTMGSWYLTRASRCYG